MPCCLSSGVRDGRRWPSYEVQFTATVLQGNDLSVTAKFMLRLLALNLSEPSEIAKRLGVSVEFVADAAAELLGAQPPLIVQSTANRLVTTEAGKQALKQGSRVFRPRRFSFWCSFNPFLRTVTPSRIDSTMSREEFRRTGLFAIRGKLRRPTIRDLHLAEVREVIEDARISDV